MSNENHLSRQPVLLSIVSGGAGASGEQLVNTVLAQFPGSQVQVNTLANVHFPEQIDDILAQAKVSGAIVVHTLVNESLRLHLKEQAAAHAIPEIDLMGNLMEHLTDALEQKPVGQPGLYRQLNRAYFDRVAAIEYTMAHDDGKGAHTWDQAEIVLVGVSRVGKTPLSMYLSVLGWKVANIPLVPEVEPHPNLQLLDPQRVIGLAIEPGQSIAFRRERQQRLGTTSSSDYTDPQKVYEELETARRIFRRAGFQDHRCNRPDDRSLCG